MCKDNLLVGYLTPDEQEKLMQVLTGRRAHLRDVLEINLHTGMRKGEILTLHKGQIDVFRDSIELTRTKSGKSRSVPIHQDLKPLLQSLCENSGPSGYLFENPRTGKPITDIKTAWRLALRDAGIPHIPFHCAGRHTFGTRAIDGGVSLSAVKEVMGRAQGLFIVPVR
ncbi:MAG TPA: site-specific integrase [Blastocatellia bacterium]|nr:site-specific integrase [Blastocatellia bacterium]